MCAHLCSTRSDHPVPWAAVCVTALTARKAKIKESQNPGHDFVLETVTWSSSKPSRVKAGSPATWVVRASVSEHSLASLI